MQTEAKQFCAIGSVKSNFGHLIAAAGVTGLIKTALSLKHRQIPPTLHFTSPNPQIDFANSPFYVNAKLTEWPAGETPRRAGVSSFGVGGTNAHVVLEEAPELEPSSPSRPRQLLLLSAKTQTALDAATANLHQHLLDHPDLNLADAAYTLQVGRKGFQLPPIAGLPRSRRCPPSPCPNCRLYKSPARHTESRQPAVAFLFPGQGIAVGQHGAELCMTMSRSFRETVDRCAEILQPLLERDLRQVSVSRRMTRPRRRENCCATPFSPSRLCSRSNMPWLNSGAVGAWSRKA